METKDHCSRWVPAAHALTGLLVCGAFFAASFIFPPLILLCGAALLYAVNNSVMALAFSQQQLDDFLAGKSNVNAFTGSGIWSALVASRNRVPMPGRVEIIEAVTIPEDRPPAPPRVVDDWQKQVIAAYPEIGEAGTAANLAFVKAYHDANAAGMTVDPRWLAKVVMESIEFAGDEGDTLGVAEPRARTMEEP